MNHRMPETALATVCGVLALLCILALPAGAQEQSDLTEIHEAFDNGRWDRHWWSIDRQTPPGVKIDLSGDALRVTIPPGEAGRPPATMKSRFRLEGDFDVQVGYEAHALPDPESEWINIQIFIDGADGPAAVMRTNHSTEGSGYSLWWEPPDEAAAGDWQFEPSDAKRGALWMRRAGALLTFGYADSVRDAELIELGRVEYGDGPVTSLEIWIVVPETTSPVDVTLDDVRVRADRIVDPSVPADSAFGPRAWYGIVLLTGLVLLGIASWRVLRSWSR